jgi:metal-responsive CopG/Arc/MetJ family transcriptional regulator
MKAIQVSIDERLLAELDADPEVKRDGRSAVMRRAVTAYLHERRSLKIAEAYRRAYAPDGGLGAEYTGWEDQGQWPED